MFWLVALVAVAFLLADFFCYKKTSHFYPFYQTFKFLIRCRELTFYKCGAGLSFSLLWLCDFRWKIRANQNKYQNIHDADWFTVQTCFVFNLLGWLGLWLNFLLKKPVKIPKKYQKNLKFSQITGNFDSAMANSPENYSIFWINFLKFITNITTSKCSENGKNAIRVCYHNF